MLYYWYQPSITINKPEIQRFKIFTRQNKTVTENNLVNENSIIEQIQKKVAKIMQSSLTR